MPHAESDSELIRFFTAHRARRLKRHARNQHFSGTTVPTKPRAPLQPVTAAPASNGRSKVRLLRAPGAWTATGAYSRRDHGSRRGAERALVSQSPRRRMGARSRNSRRPASSSTPRRERNSPARWWASGGREPAERRSRRGECGSPGGRSRTRHSRTSRVPLRAERPMGLVGKNGSKPIGAGRRRRWRRVKGSRETPGDGFEAGSRRIDPSSGTSTNRIHRIIGLKWSGRQDSNLRPPGPKPGALPG